MPGILASDNFNRANGPLAAPWSALGGQLNILNNSLSGQAPGGGTYVYTGPTWPRNQYSQATLLACKPASGFVGWVINGTDGNNFVYAYLDVDSAQFGIGGSGTTPFHIGKFLGGVFSSLGSLNIPIAQNDVFRVESHGSGNVYSAYQNGILRVGPLTDPAPPPAGAAGLQIVPQNSDATGILLGNFVAGPSQPLGMGLLQSFGVVIVSTAGHPMQISLVPINCNAIYFQALSTNTGKIYIGLAGLNKSTLANNLRVLLPPPAGAVTLDSWNPQARASHGPMDLSTIFIDADNSGEGVEIAYLVG